MNGGTIEKPEETVEKEKDMTPVEQRFHDAMSAAMDAAAEEGMSAQTMLGHFVVQAVGQCLNMFAEASEEAQREGEAAKETSEGERKEDK